MTQKQAEREFKRIGYDLSSAQCSIAKLYEATDRFDRKGNRMIYTDGTHMVADSSDELHAFANALGLKREWYQEHATHPHYDLTTPSIYKKARNRGAIVITNREILAKCAEVNKLEKR